MVFDIEKCAMLIKKSGEKEPAEGLNYEIKKGLGHYKYLGILDAGIIKQTERKGKIRKEYLRRTRKPLQQKFH